MTIQGPITKRSRHAEREEIRERYSMGQLKACSPVKLSRIFRFASLRLRDFGSKTPISFYLNPADEIIPHMIAHGSFLSALRARIALLISAIPGRHHNFQDYFQASGNSTKTLTGKKPATSVECQVLTQELMELR